MRSDEIPDRVSHLIDKVSRDLHYVKALAWAPEKFVEYAADVGSCALSRSWWTVQSYKCLRAIVIKEWEKLIGEKEYG